MGRRENAGEKLNNILRIATIICFAVIMVYFLCGVVLSPNLGIFRESARVYDDAWTLVHSDGSKQTIEMPTGISLIGDEKETLYTILPEDTADGMYLAVNTGKNFTASLDGEVIYTFDNTVSRLPGNITKTIIIPIPLKEEYAGKELTLVISDGKYDRSGMNTAYFGTMMGIVMLLVRNFALQFALSALILLAALITTAIFAYIGKRDNQKAPLINLAEGVALICLWVLFDSPLFQLVFGLYFLDGVIGFMLVTTVGLPFILYFDAITEYRHHKLFTVFKIILILDFVVLTTLHLLGIRSYDKSLVYVDLMLFLCVFVMITCTVRDYFTLKDKRHKYVVLGLVGISVFSFIEIAMTIFNSFVPFKVDIGGLFILAGVLILLFFAILDQIKIFDTYKLETQKALAATKAKSDFLANMSHEIRTPINAIMGMNEMILRECEQNGIKEYAKDISSASEILLGIVNDILDFSKIESGKLELVSDTYDFGELIYDVTTLVAMKAEGKGLRFDVIVDENLPTGLYGDDKRVREIITNLLNNAVKYTEKGYVILHVDGYVEDGFVFLTIRVEDSGQGIRKEDQDSIFEGFSQVNVKKNKNIEGTGLGLTITKRLVELMEGTIRVDSEFGKGSTFTVCLPQRVSSDEKLGDFRNHRHISTKLESVRLQDMEIPGAKILVVDDTMLNLKVIRNLLSKSKADITCVSSGPEMLDLIKENTYDLILLDHMMPGMDGIETLKASKELEGNMCRNTPVVALTANAIVGAKEMYLEAGFDDYLSKPIRMEEICDVLVKYIPDVKYRNA